MAVLGKVVWSPQTPKVGESVKVDVCGPDGIPYNNQQSEYIAINGVPGSSQYLQFAWQGDHTLLMTAFGPAGTERQSVSITVASVDGTQALSSSSTSSSSSGKTSSVPFQVAGQAELDAQLLTVGAHSESPYGAYFSLLPIASLIGRDVAGSINASLPPAVGTTEHRAVPPAVATGSALRAVMPVMPAAAAAAVVPSAAPAAVAVAIGHLPPLPPIPPSFSSYQWDFGDGTPSQTTRVPYVSHDFEHALGTTQEFQQFHVSVKVSKGGSSSTYTRTLSVMNAYVTCKNRGYVIPAVAASGWARKVGTSFVGTARITNREPAPLTLRSRQLIPIFEDNNQVTIPSGVEILNPPIVVPANGAVDVQVVAPFASVPGNSVGFTAAFSESAPFVGGPTIRLTTSVVAESSQAAHVATIRSGSAAAPAGAAPAAAANPGSLPILRGVGPIHVGPNPIDGLKIRATAHFDVQPQDRISSGLRIGNIGVSSLVATNATRQLSQVLGGAATIATPTLPISATMNDRLPVLGLQMGAVAPSGPPKLKVEDSPSSTPVVGQICDPDNLPDNLPDGFVCQATPQTEVVITPGRFMNARKGDVVLSPGGNGIIGGLLLQVTPPQRYSHSGIMTRNHDQITHCTASQDRMQAYPIGDLIAPHEPANGFRSDVVKYGWPGVMTQKVVDAVNHQSLNDPETGASYSFNGEFNSVPVGVTIEGVFTLVPPLVVKPDPMQETTALRQLLHKVADDAASQEGKAHYRFYGYTDPSIAQKSSGLAPSGVGWASGTFPAVCSAFIWLMMKRNGVNLEGPSAIATESELSPLAKEAGAQVGPNTEDGLYLYSATEREQAGNWLYNTVYNIAYDQTGWLGEGLTKAADHIANQLCNAFANDDCSDTNDSTAWQQPGDASAVSPDNVLLWNGPDRGGVLGYAEPLIYRAPRYDTVTIYKWADVPTKGTLSGHVFFNGSPLGGATLQLNDALTAFSQQDGSYSLPKVPFGPYVLNAQFVQQDGTFLSSSTPVSVQATQVTQDVALQLPPDEFRQIVVTGNIHIHWTWGVVVQTSSDSNDTPFGLFLNVGPYGTHAEASQTGDCHSAHVDFHVTADWQLDKSVTITFSSILDRESGAQWGQTFTLAPGNSSSWTTHLEADNDTGDLNFTFTNNVLNA